MDEPTDQRYRLALLGRGGMGSVYLIEEPVRRSRLALKLLRRELVASREHIERFIREASAAARCVHPHVVEVIDSGLLADGTAYILMEYLEGEDLAATLRTQYRLPWPRVRHMALQICDALAAVHDRGIVHRDLKPGNCVRITRANDPDFIKLLDFGVAKLLDRSYETLTRPGELVGTLRYMAPEQVEGRPIDFRVDIYSLGAMLYHMLTGQTAATGSNNIEVIYSLMMRPPEPFTVVAPDLVLPSAVWPVVARAMARDPAQRFQSMQAFAAALVAIDSPPMHALPRSDVQEFQPPLIPPMTTASSLRPQMCPPDPFTVVTPDLVLPDTVWPVIARAMARKSAPPAHAPQRSIVSALRSPVAVPKMTASALGPRVTSLPSNRLAERIPPLLASLVLLAPVYLLWASDLTGTPWKPPVDRSPAPTRKPSVQTRSSPPEETPTSSQPTITRLADPTTDITSAKNTSTQAPDLRRTRTKNLSFAPSKTQHIVDAHRSRYRLCQQKELRTDPMAPQRYTLAITIDPDGYPAHVEVLSMASPTMKSCIAAVTRALIFAAPPAGAGPLVVTISFTKPR